MVETIRYFATIHVPLTPECVKSPLCPREGVGDDIDKLKCMHNYKSLIIII